MKRLVEGGLTKVTLNLLQYVPLTNFVLMTWSREGCAASLSVQMHSLLLLLLLLLLSRFSCVQLSATPQTAAHQAPPSLGFSRQEHWSGLPFPSPMHESEKWKWSHDRTDCSLPGSSVHGILQARVLEWVAIAFFYRYSILCALQDYNVYSFFFYMCCI